MAGEVQTVNLGGVTYSQGIVKDSRKNGDLYEVQLNDGTKLTYTAQKPEREAKVSTTKDGVVVFEGLKYAQVFGVEKQDDNYNFSGCENCLVDLKSSSIFKQDSDTYSIRPRTLSNGTKQFSEDIRIIGDERDRAAGERGSLFRKDRTKIWFDGLGWHW